MRARDNHNRRSKYTYYLKRRANGPPRNIRNVAIAADKATTTAATVIIMSLVFPDAISIAGQKEFIPIEETKIYVNYMYGKLF